MEAKYEYIVTVADEMDSKEFLLATALKEQRVLAKIAELQRSQDMINSTYYWRRLEDLCNQYETIKKHPNG